MGRMIELQSTTPIGAYLAEPAAMPRGAIVVMQEIFGVNAHIRDVADRIAAAGYTAIAPALFDSVKPGVELGYDAEGMREGVALKAQVSFERAVQDVAAAAKRVAAAGKVGTIGFCWGGSVAYAAAIELGLPSVSYYGGSNTQLVGKPARAPLIFHYGLKDTHITAADRARVAAANPDAAVYEYEADHGFNCDHRGAYDAASAAMAWQRTLAFFAEHVG
ncbi:dienelactone hydrolase family protein [Dyella lutea]|uniref:Dienelactone hydrolase family protein n=1 Tax=Dyella lutea TaxID=2950441 RepID=A0ABT1FHU2_9GAMM|nr:dienelactone hydrolase family protein [Dyella lutea]MCP1375693.1 dienelactone hydrolase family protein [Dyella lutea]